MKILCCQISAQGVLTGSDMEAHQKRVADLLRDACENQPVELIFLPELSAIEYSQAAFENLADLAALSDGWLCASMAELARELGTPICFGMPRAQDEKVYISQLVVGPGGSLTACYDKVHIAQLGASMEQPYFTPGNRIAVFNCGEFRFGIVICYDIRFADYISSVVRGHHVDVMLHPVAFTRDGSFASWPSFVHTRALENQVYWLSLNRAGRDWGHSVFSPPWFEQESEVIELDESETLQLIELDRSRLEYAAKHYPITKHRRDDYSALKP